MSVKCGEIAGYLEGKAPLRLAEDWDNVGLLVGSVRREVNRAMVCLDVTLAVVEEAVSKKADMIISHHPLIFNGIKRINTDETSGRILHKLVSNDICVYSAHTNLDVADGGVNDTLAKRLGLTGITNLKGYKPERLFKVVVFVPEEAVDAVRDSMNGSGAGWIGNYSDCSFMVRGTGTFRPLEGTNPYIGKEYELERVGEFRLETIVPQNSLKKVVEAMIKAHPYEEVAYDVYPLEITGKAYGMGKIGFLENPVKLNGFIGAVKENLKIEHLRVIGNSERNIKKVGVFCGSFDGNLQVLIKEGIDVLVTGDIKYHTAVEIVEKGLCVIDAGHFATEAVILPEISQCLKNGFPYLEVLTSSVEADPFKFS